MIERLFVMNTCQIGYVSLKVSFNFTKINILKTINDFNMRVHVP